MKKRIFNILLFFLVCIFSFTTANGQIMPPVQDTIAVYPANPSPKDSVYVAYSYISNDGCPDFVLIKDSVIDGRIYVSKRKIDNSNRICTAMVSYFTARLNLSLLKENTQIYYNGILLKTIHSACVMDKLGVVVAVKDSSTLIKDSLSADIYAIYNLKLAIGTMIKFSGAKAICKTTPCYNLVICYEIIQTPPPPCVLDKIGFVVSGIAGCADQLFIQELSPISSSRQLYVIKGNIINSNGTVSTSLTVGAKVRFGGYLIKNDSNVNIQCRTIGVANCYEVEPADCNKDKLGTVFALKDGSTLIKDSSTGDIYALNNIQLSIGTTVKFNGVNIQCFTTPCYNLVNCYEIVQTPPSPCLMNKTGVVVEGIDGCSGQLYIEDISYPGMSMIRQLYTIQNNIVVTGSTTGSGTVSTGTAIYPIELKAGDKVRFGGYLTKNDSSMSVLCYTVGVATCYEVLNADNTSTLTGSVLAGTELIKSGYAVLFRKGYYKAVASGAINAGLFKFANLAKAEYTIYAIPDFSVYKNFLPTFYINKLKFKNADYFSLNDSNKNIVINLREFVRAKGNGKISGNIFFETYSLQDSVFAKSGSTSLNLITNIAMNTPVVLFNNNNEPVAWTVTDMAGYYVFDNIALDTYKVVAETASALAESVVVLTDNNSASNADLTLKSQLDKTGINNIENNVIALFPNPVANNLNIEVNDPTTLKMYTMLGKLLFSENLKSGINTLDISTLDKGIYIARIANNTVRIVRN